nr:zinc finger, CCHC-type [Tanacetum cinerariifolium]
MKDMTTNFGKLDKFEGHDFRRWKKKMHFLLTTLKVVYALTTSMLELMEDSTVEAIRIRAMEEEDAFLIDDITGGLCVDNTDAGIDGRFNSGSNKDKGKMGER